MSKFLGPIHEWLYGKIGHQEELTAALARAAQKEGWLSDPAPYLREMPALETVIDEENIHGWLQGRIRDAERRFATLLLAVIGPDEERMDRLCIWAEDFGAANALPAGTSPEEAYRAFEDFFVNGMPCDRVNAVTEKNEERLAWEQTKELHAPVFEEQGGDVAQYYRLRRAVMRGMLRQSGLRLDSPDDGHYTIRS